MTSDLPNALNIKTYKADGLVKVCNVRHRYQKFTKWNDWEYDSINEDIMYSTHQSWVYFIVSGEEIVKIGETGNPLGVRMVFDDQPICSTKCRLGRLRYFTEGTDYSIRSALLNEVALGQVCIWAKKCDLVQVDECIGGELLKATLSKHKDIELKYLDYIMDNAGRYPILNAGRK